MKSKEKKRKMRNSWEFGNIGKLKIRNKRETENTPDVWNLENIKYGT